MAPAEASSLPPKDRTHLVGRVAGGVDFVDRIKAGVAKRHLHEIGLHKVAGLRDAVAGAAVVVEAAADLVAVVVQAWGNRGGGGGGGGGELVPWRGVGTFWLGWLRG